MINMSYIWQDFNIKTFPAETIVFRNGVFCPELSTLSTPVIDKNYDLPIHIIYVGELVDKNKLDIIINENVKNQQIYLSAKVNIKKSAELDVVIKNSGFGSNLHGFIVIENKNDINLDINAHHLCRNTGIFIKTRLLAYKNSVSKLSGTAHIYKYCEECRSDINLSAMAEKSAKIIFMPVQKISAVPESAEHSANIAEYNQPQIEYLHQAGLTDNEIKNVLHEAFINEVDF